MVLFKKASEKDVRLIKLLKVKGGVVSLAVVEDPDVKHDIWRQVFFVPGNAKELSLEDIHKLRISYLYYIMKPKEGITKIFDVYTTPEFERVGLVKTLFGYVFREMRLCNIKKACLEWDGKDERAKSLYEGLGFKFADGEKRRMVADLDCAAVPTLCVKSWWSGKH